MKKLTIFLDLDGPLLDGKYRHYRCYCEVLKEFGIDPMPIEKYWEMKRNRCSRREQLAVTNSESSYQYFLDSWLELIESSEMLILDQVQPGALEKLQVWKGEGICLVLVTMRKNKEALMEQLQRIGLLPLLDDVIVSEHATGGKGKSAAVRVKYSDDILRVALWIGDTEVDFTASREIGCKICLVSNGIRTSEFLSQLGPDWLYDSISDVNIVKLFGSCQDHR